MINSLILAAAPVFILAFYIYYRDKYEKEPFSMLVKAMIAGIAIVVPVLLVEIGISALIAPYMGTTRGAALNAFAVASFTEEGFKWLAVLIIFLERLVEYFNNLHILRYSISINRFVGRGNIWLESSDIKEDLFF